MRSGNHAPVRGSANVSTIQSKNGLTDIDADITVQVLNTCSEIRAHAAVVCF
jgi:hypothetical protein